ncbi:peptidoglycan-associated lipoprotein Pal [Candidatus Trichorickettsia mobilis]|uniref:peptidoglycan-associated lipoprotein Pal n=1 Tax=Candidatus Trichorickettsia mobilis TaxID=1346319 RepID=UPI002931479C|nr:peptidoglycan-associated lipoprotein Pal [Candidatus Trichorickettsia mobilis]
MMKKITLALLAVFFLSGCSSSAKKGGMGSNVESSLIADFEKHAGDRVFFAFDSSSISPHSKEVLHKQSEWLKKHPHVKATIEGHADERGTREYNLALGERRAEAARKFLVHNGIEAGRLDTVSYGKERPAVIGNDEKAWSQNRRSVTSIMHH